MNFEILTQALTKFDILIDGAELHGIITGLLCAGMTDDDEHWPEILADVSNNGVNYEPELLVEISQLLRLTKQQLENNDFALELILPDDEKTNSEQCQGLISWIQGFLLGFGLQKKTAAGLSDELREGLHDLTEITRLDTDVEEDEDTSRELFSVIEFVRVTAMLCFNECQANLALIKQEKTLH